ncbi:MAG: PLP-dependent transferase, partial [Fimbriimonadaceae bacterium]|nr:PLP-dependent transferase [Alphaproteobacteria bacterium]
CLYIIEELLPRFGVSSTLVDGTNLYSWSQAVQPNTKAFFLESPTNPTLEVIDIAGVASIADQAGARLIVDNVFATPLHQRPLELGAHVVVYSATKHIDGQGRCLGGIVLSDEEFILENLHNFVRQTGPSISPFNAWVMLKGLETLDVRTRRHCENAAIIANYLLEQKKVTNVRYPGLASHPQADIVARQMASGGPIVAFEITGGKQAAFGFANALQIILISNNLGDSKSLITHPATTTHHRLSEEARADLGINDALLRLSVGLEDVSDLIADIDAALMAI